MHAVLLLLTAWLAANVVVAIGVCAISAWLLHTRDGAPVDLEGLTLSRDERLVRSSLEGTGVQRGVHRRLR